MSKILRLSTLALLLALPVQAQDRPDMERLSDALRMGDIIEVMRDEGLSSADEIAVEFLGRVSADFAEARDQIYDADAMQATVLAGMEAVLSPDESDGISAFFETELGQRIIGLEISARIAFGQEGIEEASDEMAAVLPETDPERFELLTEFITVNDLIESNVVGGLNSNYAFMAGLIEGGGYPDPPSADQLIGEIWAQESEIRSDVGRWLYSYLNLAYKPLSAEELQEYIEFSASDAGQAMNQALFEGFDDMFNGQSRAIGLLLGQMSGVQEL